MDLRKTHSALALLIAAALIGAAVMLTFKAVPEASRDLVAVVIGALAGAFGTVVKHYFDGSKSQQIRDEAATAKDNAAAADEEIKP